MRAALAVGLIVGTVAASTLGARPVAAECNPEGADLSFSRAVPLAERVVIGTVVEVPPDGSQPPGPSSRFTLAVSHVVRGEARDLMVFDFLPTHGCIRWVSASLGDQIALALDVHEADPPIAPNTAAWISPLPEGSSFESVTVRQVFRLAGNGPPDTATATAAEPRSADGIPWALLLAAGSGAMAIVLRRPTRRDDSRYPR